MNRINLEWSGNDVVSKECTNGRYLISNMKKDSIVESVVEQYKERSEVGIKKYNKTLDRDDLSSLEWLKHLQEELMDATLYIEKIIQDGRRNNQ